MVRLGALAAVALLVTGCGSLPGLAVPAATSTLTPAPTAYSTRSASETATVVPTATAAIQVLGLDTAPAEARPPVSAAVAALASRLGLPDGAEVTVVAVTAQEWGDTSLGCPEEGKVYAQVITPGYVVVLEADGESYTCHTDDEARAIVCPAEEAAAGGDVSLTVKDGSPNQPIQGGEVDTSRITPVPQR